MSEHTEAHASTGDELVIERVFAAPRELVWQAWTDPQHFVQWWGPNDFDTPYCTIDLRVGGHMLFCMRSAEYGDFCHNAPDGCGGTLSCGDTCGDGLNCSSGGLCKKALGVFCGGPGQCASNLCSWVTTPGAAARCCHDVGGWCDSDLKCCGGSVCRSGRCVAP